ncbi:PadR family transcriptional regulator [Actinomadura scrupuli]|uniref:PadR family transcriptional regulator n=1 Tax=Actinomadura scrupuli TaxID=559629 RepID=UPI003D97F372
MSGVERITGPLLDVLEALLQAHQQNVELHGWHLMRTTKKPGPTIYRVLDRLEDAEWVTAYWEDSNPDSSRPRRRFYSLTPIGLAQARTILAERRPAALNPTARPLGRPAPGPAFGWLPRWSAPRHGEQGGTV